MRRNATVLSIRLLGVWLLSLLWLGQARAQTAGLVADSTELRVLRQLYTATGGAQWTTNTNWLQGTTLADAASWYGVGVSGGDVTSLSLPTNNLHGTLPASVGQLRALQVLHLQNNLLGGKLPASLGDCASLADLWLSNNQFAGGIPAEWGHLTQLTYLELSANRLTEALPDELTQLAALGTLNLASNQLAGPLPLHWEGLVALTHLRLSNNAFTGELPASLGQLPALLYCYLDHNEFSGGLPAPQGAGWRYLRYLEVNHNFLSGPLPDSLGKCHDLQVLNLSKNQLSGPLPTTWGQLTSLEQLIASQNALTGPLPATLGHLSHLWLIDLTFNQLSGQLPGSWGHLAGLQQLYLSANRLQGPLPDSLGQLPTLGYLDLDHNQLTGVLPAAWKGLRGLQRLNVQDNQLSGPLPDSLAAVTLRLDRNQFSGPVPASYTTSPTLRLLTLEGNQLTQLPSFLNSPSLASLSLSITDNWLAFDSYERNQPVAGDVGRWYYWNYGYTQRQPPTDTLQVVRSGDALLQGSMGGAYNHYQWQRLVAGQWVDIPAKTQASLSLASVTAADAGCYRTRVTSTWVPGITLYSRAHYLDVVPYHPLDRNRPDDTNNGPLTIAPADTASWHGTNAGENLNFVRSWSPRVALTDTARVPRAPVDSVAMSTQYLDGLGRPVQTVLRQASPARRDMVQPQVYDGLDREPRQYLPYPATVAGGTAGRYRPQALREQDAFYRPSAFTGPLPASDSTRGVARTGAAYAETLFEASPLNRVLAQGAAGEAWQLTAGHVVERLERPNTAQDSVPRFQPGYDPHSLDPGYQGFYAAGELWGTEVADAHGPTEPGEHGYRTLEWKDKSGQVVLKQVEAGRVRVGSVHQSRWLRTAYAYDDFQHLRFVLQPEATKRVLPLGDTLAALPAGALPYLFHYRYDGRGRQIAKQVPGQDGETLVVYDQLDRPILSQDASQRTRHEWSLTKYDALGRLILSGLVTRASADTVGQVTLQAWAAADTAASQQYEGRVPASTANVGGYTYDHSFPSQGQQGFLAGQVLTLTYYDDYDFDNDGQPDVAYDTQSDGQFASGAAPVADALRTQGLVTRTKTRVLGVPDSDPGAWLTTTTFYDERARPVQVQTTNARGGLDLLTTQLDFTGKVVQSVAVHQGPNHDPIQVKEFFTYDHTGRLRTTKQQLPGEAQPTLLASVEYNEIGQATRKTLGTGRLKQEVDYTYNIRGWLTRLNDPYFPVAADLFNLSLHYEQRFTKGYEQYNGNLTGQTWRGRDGVQRAYGYVYDPLNRLLQGDFVARPGGSQGTTSQGAPWTQEQDNYRLHFVSYDDNGNLLTLRRQGLLRNATHLTGKQYGPVDNLTYAYQGNRLQAVNDQVSGNQLPQPASYHGAPTSLAGDFQEAGVQQAQEYGYDANGNLTQDKNKGLTGIAYNHLNLPRQIHFGQGADSLVFRYSAAGQKVAKLVYQTGKPVQRTDYLGPYQYEQDSLRFFPHAEGRVLRFVSKDYAGQATVRYQREFTFKDHLGNLRLAYRLGQVRTYTATLEQDAATRQRETQQFDSLSVSQPIATATAYSYGGGSYAARLNAGGAAPQPLGPLTQLTVQKGDSLRVSAAGLYPQHVSNSSFTFSLLSFVAGLGQPAPAGTPAGADGSKRGGLPLLQLGLGTGLVGALPQLSSGVPKGYLRVLVFNQDSVLVDQRTLRLSQAALGNFEPLHDTLTIRQQGYVTVYVGNESAVDVFFDAIQVEHHQGLQVQENEYDPYGLDLAGVSGAAPGLRLKNYYQFNGKENQLDLGLNWNHHDWRFFDYQLGRWHVVDPKLEDGQEVWTPYQFGNDNAVRFNDPDGQVVPLIAAAVGGAVGAIIGGGIEAGMQMYKNGGHVSDWHAVGGAALQGGVTGAVAGLTGGTSLLAVGAAGAVSNVAGGVARNVYDGKPITVGSVAKDAAIGAAAGVGGALAGRAVGAVASRLRGGASAAAEAEAGTAAGTIKCTCFAAGTGVSTRLGRKAIEKIIVGDSIWSYNENTHQTALRPVTQLFHFERDTVYVLYPATGDVIRTTADHPFYVRGKWMSVKSLHAGDSLVSQTGQHHVLHRVEILPEHVTVYNFTVDEFHAYFVGRDAILVHNCPYTPGHGNSLSSNKTQHGYRIVDKTNGEVMEYGISGQPLNANGTSPRVAQKLNTKYGNNSNYEGEVIKPEINGGGGQTARQRAADWEQGKVNSYSKSSRNPLPNTRNGPPRQQRPQPDM